MKPNEQPASGTQPQDVYDALKLHQDAETGRWICDIADYVSSGSTAKEAVEKTILMVRVTIATDKVFNILVRRAAQKLPLDRDQIIAAFADVSIKAAFDLAASKQWSVFDQDYEPEPETSAPAAPAKEPRS